VVDARRIRLAAALTGVVLALGVPSALGQSPFEQQQSIESRISGLQDDIAKAKAKEGALTTEIEGASQRIDAIAGDVGSLNALIAQLESELSAHRARLDRLQAQFEDQTKDYEHLKRQYVIAERLLEERLIELYQSDETDAFGLLLQVQSLGDLVDQLEYFDSIGKQDQAITHELERLREEMRLARERTRLTKASVAKETAALEKKTAEQVAARDALVAQEQALAAARADKRGILADVRSSRHADEENLEELQAASAAITAQIQASSGGGGGGSTGSGTSSSGLIWPVNGVVTSGFGWRWGRMHEGIDIAAPAGTPIHAAAAGTVIFAGWMSGYGNLTVIDHGNGLATAYGHQSAIYVGGGPVSQGQVIGAVGCTGSCTGNHVHFEVRVNGHPVDPMGYL
jgi:murein DD-endopeptidase MepM/ murein hydrolase activator NlpD